ncbi:MAG TPA: response regulator [Candidatus Binatia bacterium]
MDAKITTQIKQFFIGIDRAQLTKRVAGTKKKKILLVEQAEDWQELLTLVIRRSGYELVEANTGQKALVEAKSVIPDLILLDLGLPSMSGFEVMAELKRHSATKNIPVLVQTDHGNKEHVGRAIKAGAKDVLYKPFDLGDLPTILRNHLSVSTT